MKKILKNYKSTIILIGKLLREGSAETKENLEDLIEGKAVVKKIDEQIVFNYLDKDEEAIWSLLLASGYLKSSKEKFREIRGICVNPKTSKWYLCEPKPTSREGGICVASGYFTSAPITLYFLSPTMM